MIERLSPFRVGLALVLIGPVWFGIWACWGATRAWQPLEVPISLSPGHFRSPEFKINVEGTYWIGITVKRPPDYGLGECLIGANLCERNPSILEALWSVESGKRVVANGSSATHEGVCETGRIGREVGRFRAASGSYVLDLNLLRDGSRLNAGAPYLVVFEEGGTRAWISGQMDYGLVAFFLLAPIGIFLLIRAGIWRRTERRDALARACSLTQPWPRMQAPLAVGATPPAGAAAVIRCKTPTPARVRPRSLAVAGYRYPKPVPASLLARPQMARIGLVMLLCWTVLAIPVWLITLGHGSLIPKGLKIRLLRPGIQAPAIPGMQPLVVRVVSAKDRRGPSLLVNSQSVQWDDFDAALRKELGRRPPSWPVYLQADGNLEFKWPATAVDRIRGLHADVVLVTSPHP